MLVVIVIMTIVKKKREKEERERRERKKREKKREKEKRKRREKSRIDTTRHCNPSCLSEHHHKPIFLQNPQSSLKMVYTKKKTSL
jgi:hypothetical protein